MARICVGSYEHVLYGVDATIRTHKQKHLSVTFNPVYMFEAHTAQIRTCAIGGRYLASGGVDEVLKLYDLRRRKDLGSLLSHDGTITSIKFPSVDVNPTHMLSADENNRIIIWRVKDWTPQIQLTTRHGIVNDLSIHPSGKICLSIGTDKNVRLWNLVTGKKAAAFKLGRDLPLKVAWNRQGDGYAILFDKFIGIYDMSATLKHKFDAGRSKFHAMIWLPNASHQFDNSEEEEEEEEEEELLVATLDSGVIQILNVSTGTVVQSLIGHTSRVKAIASQRVVPEKSNSSAISILISGSTDGDLKLWALSENTSKWIEIGSYNCGESRITCLDACDAAIEDLEMVVKKRIGIKLEEVSGDENEVKSEEAEDGIDEEEEAEEFTGFD